MKLLRASVAAFAIAVAAPASADPVELVQIGQFYYEDFGGLNLPTFHILNESPASFLYSLVLDTDLGEVDLARNQILSAADPDPNLAAPDPLTFEVISSALLFGITGVDALLKNVLFSFDGGQSFVTDGFIEVTSVPFDQGPTMSIWADVSPLPAPVPEPSTLVLLLAGGALAALRRRRT
jgi:hypothetical protein